MERQITALIVAVTILSSFCLSQERIYSTTDGVKFRVETVVDSLEIPWSLVFDREGNLYFTERPGRLQVLKKETKTPILIATIDEARHRGEGGLMGLALHPKFPENKFIYLSYTYEYRRGVANKVVSYRLLDGRLTERKEIIAHLPGSLVHNGCRIKFGPDGKLYITTGDAADREIAQDLGSLGGKILRVNDDGIIPADNPDPGSPVYAFGFRNPQGIDWHPITKTLFETEHGPSGFEGFGGGGDEVNIVEKGRNYGWPIIHHREQKAGLESPLLEYTPAVAPGSGMFYRGAAFPQFKHNYFFGGLRGQRIQRIVVTGKAPHSVVREEALLGEEFRRIRDVVEGPDGFIYFSTSNRDGRASPFSNDDRILRIVPVR